MGISKQKEGDIFKSFNSIDLYIVNMNLECEQCGSSLSNYNSLEKPWFTPIDRKMIHSTG